MTISARSAWKSEVGGEKGGEGGEGRMGEGDREGWRGKKKERKEREFRHCCVVECLALAWFLIS